MVEVVADQPDTILLRVEGTLAELAVGRVVGVLHRGHGENNTQENESLTKEKEKKEEKDYLQPSKV